VKADSFHLTNAVAEVVPGDAPPRYTHDCDTCIYMGRAWHVDLYFHPGSKGYPHDVTAVARFGSDGPDYESGIGSGSMGVYEAVRRAIERGYLPDDALKLYGGA
jgi:hypothetical protein